MPVDTSGNNILLAAQVFGYAGNLYSSHKQSQNINRTAELDQQALGLQMQQQTLQATQESIAATDRLQEVLASQRAIAGARGAGVSAAEINKSAREYGREEQNRALATNYSQHQTKAQQTLLSLNRYNELGKVQSAATAAVFNNTSLNQLYKGLKGWNEQETINWNQQAVPLKGRKA